MTAVTKVLLEVVHKRRPQSEGGGLSSVDILRTREKGGVFRCERLHFLAQTTSDFSKFVVCHLLYYSILMVKIIVVDY